MTVFQVCAYAAAYEGNFIKSLRALGTTLLKKNVNMIYAFPENAKTIDWVRALAGETKVYFLPLAKARIQPKTYRDLKGIFEENPDISIVHSHFELYDVPVSMTAPKNIKIFWHLHDAIEIYNSLRHRVTHKIQYGLMHGDATVLSVSQKHMQYVLRCGFPKDRALYLPNGVDTERIKQVNTDTLKRQYDFLMFGWEFERKGVDLCIAAIQAQNINCKVAVVGAENTAAIIRKRFGTVAQVEVIEPAKDINQLYGKTRCFLHISRAEGLSYALLEAAYSGLPVICSDIPENRFAEKFKTVSMVASENVNAIGNAMKDQLKTVCCDERDVQEVRQRINKEYSISCWVNNILAEYGL